LNEVVTQHWIDMGVCDWIFDTKLGKNIRGVKTMLAHWAQRHLTRLVRGRRGCSGILRGGRWGDNIV